MNARGGSRLQLLLGLLVTAAIIIIAVRVVPIYVRSYEFKDAIRTEAKFAGVRSKSPEAIREDLYKKARDLELPVRREQISVVLAPKGVRIVTHYTVPVDLVVYQTTLAFDFSADTATTY